MAIITNGGHAQRALDFYNKPGKYFIIGGTSPWSTETNPPTPNPEAFTLDGIIALKAVDNFYIVKEDPAGSIIYNDQKWRIIPPTMETIVTLPIPQGESQLHLESISGLAVGFKLRVGEIYEGIIVNIDTINRIVYLDKSAPHDIDYNLTVKAGALIEGAHHIYLESLLEFDSFPLDTYRQAGLCTGVTPSTGNILRSGKYTEDGQDEYTSIGILEVLDNKPPMIRNTSMSEKLCVLLEF